MKKIIKIMSALLFSLPVYAQQYLGINTTNPSAMVDIASKGNSDLTKALEISNSSSLEIVKATDAGKVGINIGTSTPSALLHLNSAGSANIRHQNLPVLNSTDFTLPFEPLGVSSQDAGVGKVITAKYLYYQNENSFPTSYNTANGSGGFSLSDPNIYINVPVVNDSGLKGNSAGFTFGKDTSATVNGQVTNNVNYMIIPEPGVYLFEFYGTSRCNRYNNTQTYNLNGQMQVNTLFATATGNSYITNTIFRGLMQSFRNDSGTITNNAYAYANPQSLTVSLQTTFPNQKIALFFQYVSGEPNQFTNGECLFIKPAGANMSYYLVVTKM